jgi:hypothetical protein
MVYPSLISKSKEFSQSISRIASGGDTIEGTQISGYGDVFIKSPGLPDYRYHNSWLLSQNRSCDAILLVSLDTRWLIPYLNSPSRIGQFCDTLKSNPKMDGFTTYNRKKIKP